MKYVSTAMYTTLTASSTDREAIAQVRLQRWALVTS